MLVPDPNVAPRCTWMRALAAAAAAAVAACLVFTRHWGLNQDPSLMHYVVFLMGRGFAPYRDIVELNLPAAYMTQWLAVHVFGMGDVGWRLFDLTLIVIAAGSVWSIVRPYGRAAAALGAALIALNRMSFDIGQRDFTMAVCLLASVAAMVAGFRSRRRSALWWFAFAALNGWAAAFKPITLPLSLVWLALAILECRRQGRSAREFLLPVLAGALLPALLVIGFLAYWHCWSSFWQTAVQLAAWHRAHGNVSAGVLLRRLFSPIWWLVAAGVAALAALLAGERGSRSFEERLLWWGLAGGAAFFFYQGKGWPYQAATAEMFLVSVFALLSARVCRQPFGARRAVAIAVIAVATLAPCIYVTLHVSRHPSNQDRPFLTQLTGDLQSLGAANGNVQCMDWDAGCIHVLLDLRLVQTTGSVYDFYLFPVAPAPITEFEQQRFLAEVRARPPKLFVFGSDDWPAMQGYARIQRWPQFATWLQQNYSVVRDNALKPRGYRIYQLRQP